MEGQQNPNEPGKSGTPGQQGGQQQDREKQERERQQREREKQGGGNRAAANRVAAVNRVVAANKVVSKADDKPGYLQKESGGRQLPPLFLSVHHYNHALSLLRGLLAILDKQPS